MKNYILTEEQMSLYVEYILELGSERSYMSIKRYDEWLCETFGEDYLKIYSDKNFDADFYDYEYNYDFYYGLVTGEFNQEILEWIEKNKKIVKEFGRLN